MIYEEALGYIHSVSWTFCKPGLDRIDELCKRLGNPEKSLRFVHVAGTNGKGSFSSMLSSVLIESGLKVGMYTSPYILEFNERMQINGSCISNDMLARLTEEVKPIADSMTDKPTEFELITAIAFLYFKREKVDVVVLECGMGGRLDSTNIIDPPLLSVITGIALDHTAFLGDTVEKIAKEKAGIIKYPSPALLGGEDSKAFSVIKDDASLKGCTLHTVDYGSLTVSNMDLCGTEFSYKEYGNIGISLLGAYQPRNAALVLEAISILKETFPSITVETVKKGLAKAKWRARFEIISKEPLIIFDGAHNPEGITASVKSIKQYFGDKRLYIISGVLKDKDYAFISRELSSVAKCIYTITPDSPRALTADEYAECISAHGTHAVCAYTVDRALAMASSEAKKDGTPIICLGSLYTYADVINALKKQI